MPPSHGPRLLEAEAPRTADATWATGRERRQIAWQQRRLGARHLRRLLENALLENALLENAPRKWYGGVFRLAGQLCEHPTMCRTGPWPSSSSSSATALAPGRAPPSVDTTWSCAGGYSSCTGCAGRAVAPAERRRELLRREHRELDPWCHLDPHLLSPSLCSPVLYNYTAVLHVRCCFSILSIVLSKV
jgi:hypothetical protein